MWRGKSSSVCRGRGCIFCGFFLFPLLGCCIYEGVLVAGGVRAVSFCPFFVGLSTMFVLRACLCVLAAVPGHVLSCRRVYLNFMGAFLHGAEQDCVPCMPRKEPINASCAQHAQAVNCCTQGSGGPARESALAVPHLPASSPYTWYFSGGTEEVH